LTMAMGDNARIFTAHSSHEVLKNHYLSQAFLAGNLKEFDLL